MSVNPLPHIAPLLAGNDRATTSATLISFFSVQYAWFIYLFFKASERFDPHIIFRTVFCGISFTSM